MEILVRNVGSPDIPTKISSLTTIGFICDDPPIELSKVLSNSSNAILTAVVQGARKEEPSEEVRFAAVSALSDSLQFVGANFENEGERNYIMQVVCEATQADDSRIQEGAWGCLTRIMALYYNHMRFYMEKALFGLTIQGMKSEDEDVAKLAIEFWSTVCEEEQSIKDDNDAARETGDNERVYFAFAEIATGEVVPVLLELMTHQDEDAADDEYNVSRAAYQCLQLWAMATQNHVMKPVISFVETNLRSPDWHKRDAAVSAFGAIMEGPDGSQMDVLVKQALPVVVELMNDENIHVKDSTAYTLGRVCECCPGAVDENLLTQLIGSLFAGLNSSPKMASSCCWALINLGTQFGGQGTETNPLSPHFKDMVSHLLQLTERNDADSTLRTAAYEVLNTFITYAATDVINLVAELSDVILKRLENTIGMQSQVVSVEDRLTLEEMQTSLTSVVMSIISRLETEIHPLADRIMQLFLNLLQHSGPKSSVPDTVLAAIGALVNAVGADFLKYMEAFSPYLYNALGNRDEPGLCAMAIGLVSDITRGLDDKVQPFCDNFMNNLLEDLQSPALGNQVKPAILQCFGDIAQAIGGAFSQYLPVVAQVLQQASQVPIKLEDGPDARDYVISLREGIMDAWDGAIIAMKMGGNG
jgi:importin subunit beta-1